MDWLVEQLLSARNLCDTSLVLISADKKELLPTVLELLLIEVQSIVEENCVVENPEKYDR